MLNFTRFFRYILIIITPSVFAHSYQGELEVLVVDDFDKKQSKEVYQLHEADEIYKLNLPPGLNKKGLVTGKKVVVQGQEDTVNQRSTQNSQGIPDEHSEKVINVENVDVVNSPIESSSQLDSAVQTESAITTSASATGTRKLLTLIVNFSNLKANITPSTVDSILFTGTQSSRSNIGRSSFNQLSIARDTNNNGKPDIYTVSLNYSASGCDYNKWATDAKNAVKKSVNLTLYRHFMFVLPKDISCSWGGLGTVGCGTTCNTWVKAYNPTDIYSKLVYTHELGHNFGMQHASTDTDNNGIIESEYGDGSCTMGNGGFTNYPQTNAPHRAQMGWFGKYPNFIRSVSSGSYKLYPLELAPSNNVLRVLRIKKNSTDTYYVSYRSAGLPFIVGLTYLNKVNIHRVRAGDTRTYFIRTLLIGQTFTDSANNIRIKAMSTGGSYAVVRVN